MSQARLAVDDEKRMRRSSVLGGVGEGVVAAALPLVTAGLTRDPLAVAGVVAAQHLAWPAVAVLGPAVAGDADRRTILGMAATVRAVAVAMVGALALSGGETLLVVGVAATVLGLGEALADAAEEEAGPLLAGRQAATAASGGWRRSGMVGLALVGLPVGGLVYELAAGLPFLLDVGVFALAALAALSIRSPLRRAGEAAQAAPGAEAGGTPAPAGAAVPALVPGTAAITAVATIATAAGSAVLGVLVLFALDDLGLGAPAFGFLLAGLAAAGAAGGVAAPTVGGVLGLRLGLVVALVASGAGYAAASVSADPGRPFVAAGALGVGVAAAMVGGVLARALLYRHGSALQRGPGAMVGFHVRVWAAIPAGALAGGLVARVIGVAGAVAAAGAVSALAAVVVPAVGGEATGGGATGGGARGGAEGEKPRQQAGSGPAPGASN